MGKRQRETVIFECTEDDNIELKNVLEWWLTRFIPC